jgi:hypothetical protein
MHKCAKSSWFDWYNAIENESNSLQVIQQGVLAWNPNWMLFLEKKVNLTPKMTPYSNFNDCTLCVLSRCSCWAIKYVSWYVSFVPRYVRKRLNWRFPLESPKWGVFGDNFSVWWNVSMRPQCTYLARIYVGLERSGPTVRFPNKIPKNTPSVDSFTYMGSHDPSDHHELGPTRWSCRLEQNYKFLLRLVKGILFCEVLKLSISYI